MTYSDFLRELAEELGCSLGRIENILTENDLDMFDEDDHLSLEDMTAIRGSIEDDLD